MFGGLDSLALSQQDQTPDLDQLSLDSFQMQTQTQLKHDGQYDTDILQPPIVAESIAKQECSIIPHTVDNAQVIEAFESKQISKKRKRWCKKDDRLLFKVIYDLEKQGLLTLDELTTLDPKDAKYHLIVRHLRQQFGWKSLYKDLVKRIKSRISDYFSHRDVKLLKKILKTQYDYTDPDFEKIFLEFPGKSLQRVTELTERICESKKTKGLSLIDANNQN
ncbi:unnamed protein product [Moneuplotes crassus]|uniref:Uncharacterized protein n=1 Tax=Euplotes crassus TaxID=5936 RepID=A0AAD1UMU0_EUPCR|nr:unnamed protein product [Moneuplotes crassus]